MLAALAIVLALAQPSLHLTIGPWKGADLQTTTGAAAKYRLTVAGKPRSDVRLQVRSLAPGWVAAFCTKTFCEAMGIEFTLPQSGKTLVQFELIRTAQDAPKQSQAQIVGNGGAVVDVPLSHL